MIRQLLHHLSRLLLLLLVIITVIINLLLVSGLILTLIIIFNTLKPNAKQDIKGKYNSIKEKIKNKR